jgi:hypothetical protein
MLIAVAVVSLEKKWDFWAGAAVALAMLAKPHVGLFVVYSLIRRKWSAVAGKIITLGALVLHSILMLGWEPWHTYLTLVLPAATGGFAYIADQSLHGVLARIAIDDPNLLFTDAILTGGNGRVVR